MLGPGVFQLDFFFFFLIQSGILKFNKIIKTIEMYVCENNVQNKFCSSVIYSDFQFNSYIIDS